MFVADNPILMLVALLAVGMVCLMAVVTMGRYFKIWFQAYMAEVPIGLVQIIGLSFHKVDAKAVVSVLIMAKQAGITLSCDEIQSAYLQGADVQKIAHEFIARQREAINGDVTFQQLVDLDLAMQRKPTD